MRLESIHILRGIAASLVFLFHLVVTVDRYSPHDLKQWVNLAQFGVDIFFVISGFVMAHSVRDLSGWKEGLLFVVMRIWRIAPLLYFLTVIHLLLQSALGQTIETARIINCFTIFPIMEAQSAHPYALIPAWTLGYEMTFYLMVAATVVARLHALSAAIPMLVIALVPGDGPVGSSLMLEFIFGIAAHALWSRGKVGQPQIWLISAMLAFVLPISDARIVAWGIPAALIVMAFLAWQPGKSAIEFCGRWLGTISYSLYLSHVVTFDAIAPYMAAISPTALWVILPASGLVVSWLLYEAVEAPLWAYRRRIMAAGVLTATYD